MRRFDVVVVGAGPAGLSAAAELSASGTCLLLEQGPHASVRDRGSAQDVLTGVGGAGLFSDGKHSFFPSATALWQLPDRDALGGAYDATVQLLRAHGIDGGPLPDAAPPPSTNGGWQAKHYPSLYVPFAERLACIEQLWTACGDRWSNARVIRAERVRGGLVLQIEYNGRFEEIATDQLVIATGRWSPRWIRTWLEPLGVAFAYRRAELGVRIELDATHPMFERLPGVDGKLVLEDGELEVRTFCTCRGGEVVLGKAGGVRAYSGRADGPTTRKSNVGIVVRSADPAFGHAVAPVYSAAPVQLALAEWIGTGPTRLDGVFGPVGARAVWRGLQHFLRWAPELGSARATVYAPAIEGVGDYPVDDGGLAIAPRVWIAGDAGGRFRGIVASMVSGRYIARRIRSRAG
ncbi:MAG TPA: FAD-binding protein [Kofleriaceae bacterium]|nr:FAD-binding protein [Kofleriaceae bacterium]